MDDDNARKFEQRLRSRRQTIRSKARKRNRRMDRGSKGKSSRHKAVANNSRRTGAE